MTEHGYARTICACAACVSCCRTQPGPLAPGDLERIARHLGLTAIGDVEQLFWASPGAVVGLRGTATIYRIGTITPQLRDGRCVFLTADDRCAVHDVAPFGCAFVDPHMDRVDAEARSLWLYRRIATDGDYQFVRAALPTATSWRPRVFPQAPEKKDGLS